MPDRAGQATSQRAICGGCTSPIDRPASHSVGYGADVPVSQPLPTFAPPIRHAGLVFTGPLKHAPGPPTLLPPLWQTLDVPAPLTIPLNGTTCAAWYLGLFLVLAMVVLLLSVVDYPLQPWSQVNWPADPVQVGRLPPGLLGQAVGQAREGRLRTPSRGPEPVCSRLQPG